MTFAVLLELFDQNQPDNPPYLHTCFPRYAHLSVMAQSALKKRLREEYLLKRSLMPLEDASNFSLLIEDYLLGLPEFAGAGSVGTNWKRTKDRS
jgi:hypothetical protein